MGSNILARGMYTLMVDIVKYLPSPEKRECTGINAKTNEVYPANYDFAKPKSAYVFKTIVAVSYTHLVSSAYKKSVGQSFTLKPKAKGKITYKTGNKKVATVNSKGKVTVKGTGKATITVTAKATSTYSKSVKKITV